MIGQSVNFQKHKTFAQKTVSCKIPAKFENLTWNVDFLGDSVRLEFLTSLDGKGVKRSLLKWPSSSYKVFSHKYFVLRVRRAPRHWIFLNYVGMLYIRYSNLNWSVLLFFGEIVGFTHRIFGFFFHLMMHWESETHRPHGHILQ